MRRSLCFLIVLTACCLAVFSAAGQSATSANIVGQVTDAQGAVVPNLTVTATNDATGISHAVKTTSSGNYTIPNLSPGIYTVKVTGGSGLSSAEAKAVKLNLGDNLDLKFQLKVAEANEVLEVTAQTPLIETTKTQVASSITSLDMENLPTIAGAGGTVNDYAQLALTAPGVKQDTSGLTTDLIAPGSINNRGNLYNVDGANITDQLVSGRDGTGASIDEVQEFQVITNNYNAEYGQAGGLVVNVVTKSGTNGIHGDGHMYFRGRNLSASDPFYNLGLLDPATGLVNNPRCPLDGTTDISGCPRAPFHRKEGGFTLGGPFIKDRLFWFTSFELSQQASPLTLTPFGVPQTVQQPVNNLLYSGKVDYKVSQNNLLTVRYAVDRARQSNVIVQTGSNVTPDDLTSSTNNNANINIGLVSSLTPNLTNESRFVFTRFVTSTADNSNQPGIIHSDGTTTGADFCCPQGGLQKRYQYVDNLTWTKGKHTWKTGFNISYYPWNSLFPQFHFGQYVLNAANQPTSLTVAFGPGEVTSKDNIYGFYVQDTWKITSKLTMNYGIRYDFEAGAFKGGKIPGPNGTCFQGNGLISACSSDNNNWQPRLGFTYAPWSKTLFRLSFAETTQLAFNNVVLDSLNFDGTTLNTVTIDSTTPAGAAALAAFPNIPSAALLAPFAPSLNGPFGRVRPISSHLKNPELRSVNFGIEQELTKTLSVGAQYIGQFGFGLFGERDLNAPPVLPDPAHPGFFFFGQRPNPLFAAERTNENSRTSHYDGLLLNVNKRFSSHVQFVASYTWSHALTSGEDFFGLSEPADGVNIRPELGPAFNDIRHAANMGVVLDSGKLTQSRVVGWFANNLGMSFVGQIQSGRPYPISTGTAGFGGSERFFGAGSETQQRPSVLPNGALTTSGIASFNGSNALFGPGAVTKCIAAGFSANQCSAIQNTFAAPVANSGAIDTVTGDPVDFQLVSGNLSRDLGRGSPFVEFDPSLRKSFSVPNHENVKLELRFDAFNVFNHSNFGSYNSNDVLSALSASVTNAGQHDAMGNSIAVVNPDFFSCNSCLRPTGTYAGSNGQTLHLSDLQHGRISQNLLNPVFNLLGDPAATTGIGPRKLQLSFHVRF
ncbi:MAG TPA: TonB-dependent receptor [Candidatus Angelobacter sp.]|nr:TonB-dependent receptor [Candidatus Angelobacter sp.]